MPPSWSKILKSFRATASCGIVLKRYFTTTPWITVKVAVIILNTIISYCSTLKSRQNFGAQCNTPAADFWMCIPLNESWSVACYKLAKIGQFFRGTAITNVNGGSSLNFWHPLWVTYSLSVTEGVSHSRGCRKALCHNSKTYYIKKAIVPPLCNEVYSLKENSFLLFIIQAYYIFTTVNWDLRIEEQGILHL